MLFSVVGINHKKSPIAIREKFYLNENEKSLLFAEFKMDPQIAEAMIISTCNRTEIYALATNSVEDFIISKLCEVKNHTLTRSESDCFYIHTNLNAVNHLLNVSAGLDSLVIGEKEILGQIKGAVELARKKNMFGRFFNLLSNVAIRTGKLARSQTQISCGGSSVSWAAVEMAKSKFESLQGKSVLVVGAGKMSHLAANDFVRKGVEKLYIMNRTKEKGEELAKKYKGIAKSFWEMEQILSIVDVCICSSSAPHYLIDFELVQTIMKKRTQPLILIDISMPRNIDPNISTLKNIELISLDELDKVLEFNVLQRLEAVHEVENIIKIKYNQFLDKLKRTNLSEYTLQIDQLFNLPI